MAILRQQARARQQGYSLLELALVITIVGVSTLLMSSLVMKEPAEEAGETESVTSSENVSGGTPASLTRAQARLRGFIRSHNRLPCPDVDGDGLEDCGSGAGINHVGTPPYRTMGLSLPLLNGRQQPLRYGVYRNPHANPRLDRDLAVLVNRFDPLLPNGEVTGLSNGLDFCQALRGAANLAGTATQVHVDPDSPLNQAYVLVDPGAGDADGAGDLLDARNAGGLGFELPDHPQGRDYDDRVLSIGFPQLAVRLGCPDLMASVNSAARAAVVAEDVADLTAFFRDFRAYSLDVAEDGVVLAGLGVGLAAVDIVLTTVDAAIALAQAIDSAGASAAPTAVVIGIATGLVTYTTVEAAKGLADAISGEEDARALYNAAMDAASATSARAAEQLSLARLIETRVRLQ